MHHWRRRFPVIARFIVFFVLIKTSFFLEWGIAEFEIWRVIETPPRHCTAVHTDWTTDIVPSYSSIVHDDILKYVFQHVLFQNYFHIHRFPTATKVQFKNRLDPYYDTLLKTNRTRRHFNRTYGRFSKEFFRTLSSSFISLDWFSFVAIN